MASEQDQAEMAEAMGNILSDKDRDVDNFLLHMAEKLCREFECDENGRVSTVAEEKTQMLLDLTDERLSGISLTLEHKFGAMLKKYITLCQERKASRALSRVKVPPQDLKRTAENYRQCFSSYVESPFVTYAATCEKELGRLSTKDAFVLHLWCMLNCYRAKGDQMFAVSVCGVSSVGKSSLFEAPAFENGHSYVAEAGVGRFAVKKRSTLIYSDIALDVLYKSKDAAKFRTIARSEPTTCKVFADTCTLPPLWILITSNQRIHSHVIPQDPKNFFPPKVLPSELVVSKSKKNALQESLAAVRNRVIECYCRKRPEIDPSCLPTSGSFSRIHFLLGAYSYVIGVLQKYDQDSFYSPMLLKYVFTSLCDNMELYLRVMDDGRVQRRRLVALIRQLVTSDEERVAYLNKLRQSQQFVEETEDDGEEKEVGEDEKHDVELRGDGEFEPKINPPAKGEKRETKETGSVGLPPAKKKKFVESDLSESESTEEDERRAERNNPSEESDDSDSSDSIGKENCNDSSCSCSSTSSTSSSSDSEDEDFTCNFDSPRFEQDAQELV